MVNIQQHKNILDHWWTVKKSISIVLNLEILFKKVIMIKDSDHFVLQT